MKIGIPLTAFPGSHEGIAMPPHPVTAVERQSLALSLVVNRPAVNRHEVNLNAGSSISPQLRRGDIEVR